MSNFYQTTEYDPQSNWKVLFKEDEHRSMEERAQKARKRTQVTPAQNYAKQNKLDREARIDDLIPRNPLPSIHNRLEIQKSREMHPNNANPRFVNTIKYYLKSSANKFRAEEVRALHEETKTHFNLSPNYAPVIHEFSLSNDHNEWRIKDRDETSNEYILRNNTLDTTIKVHFSKISAFPEKPPTTNIISQEELIRENNQFRQNLYHKMTELDELQAKFDHLKITNDKAEEHNNDDYWRRQYTISQRLTGISESNLHTITKQYAIKNLEIQEANKRLGEANKKLTKENADLHMQVNKLKMKKKKLSKTLKKANKLIEASQRDPQETPPVVIEIDSEDDDESQNDSNKVSFETIERLAETSQNPVLLKLVNH